MTTPVPPTSSVLRLSLRWVIFLLASILLLSFLAGVLGSLMTPQIMLTQPTLQDTTRTIRPASPLTEVANRSAPTIVSITNEQTGAVASGVLLTTDGLIATSVAFTNGTLHGLRHDGSQAPLQRVGTDSLYGLTYVRWHNNTDVPLALAEHDASIGQALYTIARAPTTAATYATDARISSYTLPPEGFADGIHYLLQTQPHPTYAAGAPLVTDDAAIAGLIANATNGTVIPATAIKQSLARVVNQQQESNPVRQQGIALTPTMVEANNHLHYGLGVTITGDNNSSPVSQSLQTGDVIIKLNDNDLALGETVEVEHLFDQTTTLELIRNGQLQTVSVEF